MCVIFFSGDIWHNWASNRFNPLNHVGVGGVLCIEAPLQYDNVKIILWILVYKIQCMFYEVLD